MLHKKILSQVQQGLGFFYVIKGYSHTYDVLITNNKIYNIKLKGILILM